MKLVRLSVAVPLALLLAACQTEPSAPYLDDDGFEQLFQRAYVEPFNRKDIDAWVGAFTADAVGLHNGLPALVGRDAIRGFGEAVRDNFTVARIEASIDEIRRADSWAYTRGSFTSRFVPKEPDQGLPSGEQTGKFLLIWEMQDDGEWRIILDMGNSSGPP